MRALRFAGVAALVLCAVAVVSIVYCYNDAAGKIDQRLASGYLTSRAGLYAAPRVLRAGQNFSRERLTETLRRAGYVEQSAGEQSASDVWSGAFRVVEGGVEISPRRSTAEHAPEGFTPEVVRVAFDRKGRINEITGDGVGLAAFTLEPEALTTDAATKTGTRATLAYADIPPVLANAIRAIEDRRFFEHHGIDPTGIGRALLSWTGDGSGRAPEHQGGSTITQQLVKNTYLTPERTLSRKFNEALLAAALERRLSKEDIFALYCNEIYLGQRGAFAVRGVKQAARVYFGKELRDLSLAEAATIAGMIQSPARYAPDRHAEASRARRNAVLASMLRDNLITHAEAESASHESISVAPVDPALNATAPYFVDYVNRAVESRLQQAADDTTGADERSLRVYTTIDLDLQQLAEAAVARQLAQLEKVYRKQGAQPQAALVALDPNTGHVLAMVGGRNYGESQLNRATDARRQPGSVFKPFVYAAAIEQGISPVRLFTDAPRAFNFDRHSPAYRPANYGGGYSMSDVTMRTALTKSLNVATVDLAMQTGLPRVAALAESFGLQKAAAYPSLALGTSEATPLEIASAYTAFAGSGTRTRASAMTRAVDGNGLSLFEEFAPARAQVVQPSTAYMITDMLTNVIADGTARAAHGMLKLSAVAGKTGTSRDGWFVGYTPNLVCVVWIGFDDNQQLGLTGAESALPVWSEFIRGAVELRPELGGAAFLRPAGIMSVDIDPATGQLASPSCPVRERIAITPALAPTSECFTHQTLFPLLASYDAQQLAPHSTVVLPHDSTRAAASSRTHVPHDDLAPAVLPAPSIQTTRSERSRNGRARLTNDLQIVSDHAAKH
jgi:penicillin-binding protein 1B